MRVTPCPTTGPLSCALSRFTQDVLTVVLAVTVCTGWA